MFSILGGLIMFRSINVGNDTDIYTYLYESINNNTSLSAFLDTSRFEIGYILLNRVIGFVFNDKQFLFIVTGGFTAFAFGRFFYHYSLCPWMSVYMFLTLQFFDLSLSGVRQIVAISILTFAFDKLVNRKTIPFFIIVLLASLIHWSSILFLIMLPFSVEKKSRKFYFVSGVIAIIVFAIFPYLYNLISIVFPQYMHYFTQSGNSYSNTAKLANILMFLMYFILFIIINLIDIKESNITFDDKNDERLVIKYYRRTMDINKIAVWFSIIMLLMSMQGTILNRFKYVFSFPLLVAYPNAIVMHSNNENKSIITLISLAVFFTYILVIYTFRPEWQSSYPYIPFWS